MKFIIEELLESQDLNQSESKNVMLEIMSGEYDDAQISGFLIALRSKGAKSEEIAGFAEAMREKMTHIKDCLSATYLKTKPSELIEMLERAGFYEIRRLNSPPGDKTSWDINRVNNSLYGEERFGTGELRYFCVLQ